MEKRLYYNNCKVSTQKVQNLKEIQKENNNYENE